MFNRFISVTFLLQKCVSKGVHIRTSLRVQISAQIYAMITSIYFVKVPYVKSLRYIIIHCTVSSWRIRNSILNGNTMPITNHSPKVALWKSTVLLASLRSYLFRYVLPLLYFIRKEHGIHKRSSKIILDTIAKYLYFNIKNLNSNSKVETI